MLSELVSRTRRNHALEHATINVLSEKHKNFSAQGNSSHRGFYLNIYGDIPEQDVVAAVEEAHNRMKQGEEHLALHPNCGTVLLTTSTMAALAAHAMFGLEQRRQRRSSLSPSVLFNALPAAVLAVTVTLIISRPLGMALQAYVTTDGHLGDLRVRQVRRIAPSVITRLFQLLLGQAGNQEVRAYHVETTE
ncbi:MAG: DUF6391 domain-containing protein [Chloroflexi bacterium]|nr:DUF6391 domain-containing protein [Chloroflexota bacterium]MCI0576663.1 DUF6391 domain-containing protein [Chloroflexota bacterium]MCI0647976.1 DUF6391 domain-containing protein [Chloroflexota bacterium]MCI0726814.1 DUF6391 domain-containing protein [Chloroflexota bacterium]